MAEIVDRFEKKARRFENESEAKLIRQKLDQFITNSTFWRDKRFQSNLIQIGSVYEGVNVCRPDEFDLMMRIDSLINKTLFHTCYKGKGYVRLLLDE